MQINTALKYFSSLLEQTTTQIFWSQILEDLSKATNLCYKVYSISNLCISAKEQSWLMCAIPNFPANFVTMCKLRWKSIAMLMIKISMLRFLREHSPKRIWVVLGIQTSMAREISLRQFIQKLNKFWPSFRSTKILDWIKLNQRLSKYILMKFCKLISF